jgi:ABC-type polysaccharide transport system permease subunit
LTAGEVESTRFRTPIATAAPRKRAGVVERLREKWRGNWMILAFVLPGLVYFIVFHYLPLFGYVIAFQDYLPFIGFVESDWVGFDNFRRMFADPRFWNAVVNTLVISGLQLVLFFPAPIALAIIINSLISMRVRRFVQSVIYLPHFISWVIVVSLFQHVMGGSGLIAHELRSIGLTPPNLMSEPDLFKWMMVLQLVWKETGWGTIIYLAALLSIDQSLYEAAAVDGAGRWRRLWHITLPGLVGITVLLAILRLGQILTVGFEQILLQRDFVGPDAGEVLDTYVYFNGIVGGQWSITAAAGLIKGVVGAAMVLAADRVARHFWHTGIFAGRVE